MTKKDYVVTQEQKFENDGVESFQISTLSEIVESKGERLWTFEEALKVIGKFPWH